MTASFFFLFPINHFAEDEPFVRDQWQDKTGSPGNGLRSLTIKSTVARASIRMMLLVVRVAPQGNLKVTPEHGTSAEDVCQGQPQYLLSNPYLSICCMLSS